MKEFEVTFISTFGMLLTGYFYGTCEADAKANAIKQGVSLGTIRSIEFKENYRGYGHI